MNRPIAIVGAPSSIGIRPYDEGGMRRLDIAPGVLRDQADRETPGARDLGDVVGPPYRDFVRPPGRPRNENDVANYSRELAARICAGADDGSFVLVLGGDCNRIYDPKLDPDRSSAARLVTLLDRVLGDP